MRIMFLFVSSTLADDYDLVNDVLATAGTAKKMEA